MTTSTTLTDGSDHATLGARPTGTPLDPAEADLLLGAAVLTDEGRQDPYEAYRRLREGAPRYYSASGAVVVADYAGCLEVLRNPALGRSEPDMDVPPGMSGRERRTGERQHSMLFANPPDHTRLRSLVSRTFTPRRIEAMRPRIEALLAPILDEMAERGTVDVLEVLGARLPAAVISELLGVPPELHDTLAPHVRASTAFIDAAADDDAIAAAEAGVAVMGEVFEQLITEKRRSPDDGLLSALIQVEEAGDRLSHEELLANTGLMYAAGFETTTNLIGNALHELTQWPDERGRLTADPSLIDTAVDEILRFQSPNQLGNRITVEPCEFHGETVAPGTRIHLCIGAANRDPRQFADPDRLDLSRKPNRHLAFAQGPHLCAGFSLARMEGRIAISRLLARFPDYSLDGEPTRTGRVRFRGFSRLPARVG